MPNTPYLGIPEVTASQNQKEITINDAIIALEAATNAVLTVDYTGITTYTLSGTQATRNMIFKGGACAADCDLKFPTTVGGNTFIRVFVVRNDTGHNLTAKYATGVGTTVVVPNGHSRLIAALDGTNMIVAAEPGTAVHFVDLLDVPGSFTGQNGKAVAVKTDETGLEFITVSNFPSFTGNLHKVLAVNAAETGVEWVTPVKNFKDLSDVPASYATKANKLVAVNGAETGLVFIDPPPTVAVEFPTSDQWRLRIVSGGGATQVGFGEIQMIDVDGINRSTGGTPTSSSFDTGHEPTYAFDGITTTGNGWLSAVADVVGAWIKYTFTSPVSIRSVKVWDVNGFITYTPNEFIIERWNGSSWVNVGDRIPDAWVDGASQTFLVNGEALSSVPDVTSDGIYYTRRNAAWESFSAALNSYGSAQGVILFRGATDWQALAVGTAGQVLQSGGAAANVSWLTLGTVASLASDTDGTLAANSDTSIATQKAVKTYVTTTLSGTGATLTVDTDNTLAANSDTRVATQKAVKGYVDTKIYGVAWKQQVRAATVVAGTLASSFANGSVIDTVTLVTGDRILIKNQVTASENGIYTVNVSGAPTRALDANTGANLVNASCYVSEGSLADTQWTCTTNAPITPDSTSLAFAQMGVSVTLTTTTDILTGTDASKAATAAAIAALWKKGADVASAATTTFGDGGFFHVTGTTTITALALTTDTAGRMFWVDFTGALTLTHNVTSLILPTAANIVTVAGDTALFVSEGSGNFRCLTYRRADGTALVAPIVTTNQQTIASAATVTPTFLNDVVMVTALAVGITINNPTGTVDDGHALVVRIKDNGTARTIAFDTQFRAMGVTLPTTTVISKWIYISMIYNATDTKWDVVGVLNQA